ncbi:MAG: hypothetical protein ABSB09_08310 [Acidimicrobiales bacterium]|jgi:putative component of toxin-antitoxin plasmid stabilization module
MTADELEAVMRKRHVRMVGIARVAQIISGELGEAEKVNDVVKAYRVKVDGKRIGTGSGFSLLFLTNERILISCGTSTSVQLNEIVSISDLIKGRFKWKTIDGRNWSFERSRGLVRMNGNRPNTNRFYAALAASAPGVSPIP